MPEVFKNEYRYARRRNTKEVAGAILGGVVFALIICLMFVAA